MIVFLDHVRKLVPHGHQRLMLALNPHQGKILDRRLAVTFNGALQRGQHLVGIGEITNDIAGFEIDQLEKHVHPIHQAGGRFCKIRPPRQTAPCAKPIHR